MLPLYTFFYFLFRLTVVSTVLWWASAKVLERHVAGIVPYLGVLSVTISLVGLILDARFFYPRYRSPLRTLPTVTIPVGRDHDLIIESPRGSTPLKWVTENPHVDILNIKGLRFMPETIIPISPSALRDLMSTNTYDFVKPSGLRTFLGGIIGYGLITTEGNVHKRQRKALVPAFNVKHIRALYPAMWQETGTLLQEMQKDCDKNGKVEVGDWASRLALDIIGRSALSRNFRSLTTSEHPVAQSFASILEPEPHMVRFLGLNLIFPVALTRLLPVEANRVVQTQSAYLRNFCNDLLADQQRVLRLRAEKEKGRDHENEHTILTNIIESGDFTNDELVDQMLTFIAAGHETTGSSISWAMHLLTLAENKHYQKLIRDEIRAGIKVPEGADAASFELADCPQWHEFESFPYLNGLCEEILRLFPAVPTTLRESIRQTTLAGQVIPADTLVLVVPWAINRNPHFWGPEADKLRPERWIDRLEDGTMRPNRHGGAESNYCEITFLHGQRACIGRDFAKAELRCVLASILGRFEVNRLAGDNGDVEITGAVTTKPRGGLRIHLTRVPGW
ncbi:cytochrome P450 [Pseudovirgaria hyperparasitica]|uniref:Cytochrome P450 n=1 Tax=Pseudovirgaria hyperparasitica TaxID=470096 RepID=A0A6A6WGM6_9PEZI|nr:cytochrome P450 [Pseudovirgaria hyperparasitica]KAF2762012.1 cytochrome P450 [Pseudovirgaria hyperparasitica]